ncbi:hypothetical protein H0H93_009490 [Arthromyces matolae]|nr:hypothetical protein H0H93_009490 [Arthromyces matolae]
MSRVELPDESEDIYSYFNKSVSAVQEHADHFEEIYARPALRTSQAFFDDRPISARAVIICCRLVRYRRTDLGRHTFFDRGFVITSVPNCLLITFSSSAFLTITGICTYSFASLLNHLRIHGSPGISLWMDRMIELFFGTFLDSPQPGIYPNDERSSSMHLPPDGEGEGEWTDTENTVDQPNIENEDDELMMGLNTSFSPDPYGLHSDGKIKDDMGESEKDA